MSNNPRLVVFKLKELIYTGIFIILGILLIILFINMFKSGKNEKPSASSGEVNVAADNPITTDDLDDTTKNSTETTSNNSESSKNTETTYTP